MHQMYVTKRENSTITPNFRYKKIGVAITEMKKFVGGSLERKIVRCLSNYYVSYVSNRH